MTDPSIVLGTIGSGAPPRRDLVRVPQLPRLLEVVRDEPLLVQGLHLGALRPRGMGRDAATRAQTRDRDPGLRGVGPRARSPRGRDAHPNLTTVPNARCEASPDESATDAFLRCDLMGQAATYADVVETQAQQFEREAATYRDFVEACAAQARERIPTST